MDFLYGGAFRTGLPEAYERLILDAMLGDATLFTRADEVDEQWALVDSIVAAWKRDRPSFPNYEAGTGGRAPPTTDPPGRPVVAAALTSRRRRQVESAGGAAPASARGDADERDDACGLGAAAMGRGSPADARRARGAAPLADDPALPRPEAADGIDVHVDLKCFTVEGTSREVCSDVIELRLGGKRTRVPGSIVLPLLITDLPTFCRWRGLPPWGEPELEQLVDVCDRLVVDSSEWRGLPGA